MSDTVAVSGTLQLGPANVSDSSFPAAVVNITLSLKAGDQKIATVSDKGVRLLASPSVFVDMRCVGPGEAVTKGTLLYVRSSVPMLLRLTTDDGAGGSVLAVIPIDGLYVHEVDQNKFLKLLEAQGQGTIEFLVSGAE